MHATFKMRWPIPGVRREPLYAITDFGKLDGTYNLQIVTILVIVALKALVGNRHFLPEAVAGGSLLIALLVDTEPWGRKLSPMSVVKQTRSAVALLVHVIHDVWPVWIVALALGILLAQSRGAASIFGDVNTAGTVSFLALVTVRGFFAIRYLILAARKPWPDVVEAPLAMHRYNFSTRSRALRHIVWTFFIGNVGIYALAESYVWMAGTAERIHDLAGDLLPYIDYKIYVGLLVLLAGGCFVWFRLLLQRQSTRAAVPNNESKADPAPGRTLGDIAGDRLVMYKIHRTLHQNLTLFESVHRVHHLSVYPTVLDAIGTQAAIEIIALSFASTPIQFLLPDALWFVVLFLVMRGECLTHHTPTTESDLAHHQQHHRFLRWNYGIGGPCWDKQFGTQRPAPMSAS